MSMRVIPVLDVKEGIVVRGVGGRRDEYRPLVSRLTSSVDPVTVATALIDRFQSSRLYLGYFDADAGKASNWAGIVRRFTRDVKLMIDAGVRCVDDALPLYLAGIDGIICGLETLDGLDALRAITKAIVPERIIFS